MTPAVWLWTGIGSLLLSGVFSTMHQSLRVLSRAALEDLVCDRKRVGNGNGERPRLPATLAAIVDDLPGHSAAVAVPRVVFNLLVGVSAVIWVSAYRHGAGAGIDLTDAGIGVTVSGVLLWIVGVALPISIAEHASERIVAWLGWSIRAVSVMLSPLRVIVSFITEVVRRLTGEAERDTAEAREAELLSLVEEQEREGDLDESAREMIEAVVELRSTTVEQIMTPRTEIQGFEYTDNLEEVKRVVREFTHSRIPVYDDNLDQIVGVLYLKDMLRWLVSLESDRGAFSLRSIVRDAMFVPETKTVRELLAELLEKKVHLAFALDEYGGVSGLVTIEDIIEEVFGEIQDEYEPEEDGEPQIVVDRESRSAVIDARAEIDDANDELEALDIELPESDDWDTVGGFVITTMGKIPDAGDTLEHDGRLITVLEAEPTRVVRVRIERAVHEPADQLGSSD